MTIPLFTTPSAPASLNRWEDLTANEQAWIEFIRVISCGRDPRVTPARVTALRELLDTR